MDFHNEKKNIIIITSLWVLFFQGILNLLLNNQKDSLQHQHNKSIVLCSLLLRQVPGFPKANPFRSPRLKLPVFWSKWVVSIDGFCASEAAFKWRVPLMDSVGVLIDGVGSQVDNFECLRLGRLFSFFELMDFNGEN
ncbi:hypothetical protein NC651_033702 [Populus alba x Populus x berolinensis]|nr:hypothetical protein NC651_033702 [Populus alba x Populus x berolinensis]